ncbi:hypothetical protein VCHA54P500_20203 [Vibrio chagasii]|nr:hypothetical protein VCHA34P117_20125 [Vibrio chagasii]CAH7130997.1 hypothetical protein VCHA48P439_20125 [Vibrio chagasii]CAH7144745.1 hypothetical protein VCHA40O236_20125 [Vibrio chagasii]CAH7204268.1 hypothetical protein VCHA54P500_20203 [Vibrio chagasii]CAH7376752.1 hypothetical protein VCHA53O462_20125 [Vibrio chagasii]
MKIAILDDYQNAVKNLECYRKLADHDVTVFTEAYPENELALKLYDFEALVLIRERTEITESLLSKLPNLKVISQTGKVSNHIDPQLCERFGVTVLEGRGSPVAPSELCWALIMAASRHIPTYASNLKHNQWQDSGVLGLGRTLRGLKLGIWGYEKSGAASRNTPRRSGWMSWCGVARTRETKHKPMVLRLQQPSRHFSRVLTYSHYTFV